MFNVQHFWPPPTVKLFWLFKLKEVKVYSLFHAKFNLLTACGSLSLSATSLCPLQLHMHHLAYPSHAPCLCPCLLMCLFPTVCATSLCPCHHTHRITMHPATTCATLPCPRHCTCHGTMHPTAAHATSLCPYHCTSAKKNLLITALQCLIMCYHLSKRTNCSHGTCSGLVI